MISLDNTKPSYGYKPTWAGLVEAQPNPLELHALITPPELLYLTLHRRQLECRRGRAAAAGVSRRRWLRDGAPAMPWALVVRRVGRGRSGVGPVGRIGWRADVAGARRGGGHGMLLGPRVRWGWRHGTTG